MIIGQRYEILRPLRSEIHGEVFLARDQVVDVDVGLKYLANERPEFERFLEYYRREALWGLKIHHPQILGIHHLDEGAEGVFLIQEPFIGSLLEELLDQSSSLTTQDALYFIEVLAQGLAYGHKQGIFHQNLTPRQVLVSGTGGIKIINWAFPVEPQDLMAAPALQTYIPPEIWAGQPVTAASNLFSLGVIGYQMLTGRLPFPLRGEGGLPYQITTPPEHLELIPEPLRPLFNRCLKPDPDKRFKSAQDFLTRLAIQREKLSTGQKQSRFGEGPESSAPLAEQDRLPLKIMPMEPEVEINPDWQETPRRAPSSWTAANNWVMAQRQRVADYLGPAPLSKNRRKQWTAAIGGGVGLLVLLLGLSSLFGPSGKPQAVVRTAQPHLEETTPGTSQTPVTAKPPVLAAAPPADSAGDAKPTSGAPPAKTPDGTTAATATPPLPEPAAPVKPAVPATPVKPEKPHPVVKTEKPAAKTAPKPTPTPAAAKSAAAPSGKPTPAVSNPKLTATFDKETQARQKADALIKQGQRALVKKAKKGNKTVYQVWLQPTAATGTGKANTKTVQTR